MIEDVVRKQKSSKKSRHLIMMGARTIEDNQCTLMALDEKQVKEMLKDDPDFARHANLVSSYDPSTELVIAFDVESPAELHRVPSRDEGPAARGILTLTYTNVT